MKPIFFVILASVLAGSAWAGGDWTTFHGDESLSGYTDTRLPTEPVRLWRFNAGAAVTRTPVAAGSMIVVVTDTSELIALDLKGARQWSVKVETGRGADGKPAYASFQAPPAIVNGLVLIGSMEGVLHAFDLRTGAVRWTNSVGAGVVGTAGGFRETNGAWRAAVVSQPDGVLHAFDLATGKQAWTSAPTDRCDGSPAFSGNLAVFGSCAAALHVIGTADGRLIRTVELEPDCQVAGGVAVSHSLAFAGTRKGSLVCVDLADGAIRWTNDDVQGELFTTPALGADRVVFAADDGKVRCVRRDDGKQVWSAAVGSGRATSPAIAGDKVVAALDGKLIVFALSDGSRLWSAEVADETSGPALVGGMIVIGGDDGLVTAFGEKP
jgi:outer membrane protein assembly factor BamB